VSLEFTRDLYLNFLQGYTALPDVVIYFSVNTETALKRRVKRGGAIDVIEAKGTPYQELVRGSFEKYLDGATDGSDLKTFDKNMRVFTVDANDTIEGVQSQIDTIVNILTLDADLIQANG
jgi:thymidylate kinase